MTDKPSIYAALASVMCARPDCDSTVPPSSQRRLYCSRQCKRIVNGRADYLRRLEVVKASARAFGASSRGQDLTLRRRYGITLDEREAMRDKQDGTCVFCDRTSLYIDHDHLDGRFRGLLCMQHNGLLGHLGDGDVGRINVFLDYLGLAPTHHKEAL